MVNCLYVQSAGLFRHNISTGTKSLCDSFVNLPPGTRIEGESEFAYMVTDVNPDSNIVVLAVIDPFIPGDAGICALACALDELELNDPSNPVGKEWRAIDRDVYNIYDEDYCYASWSPQYTEYMYTYHCRDIMRNGMFSISLDDDREYIIELPEVVKLIFNECESVKIGGYDHLTITFEYEE